MAKATNINNRRYLGNKYKLLSFIKRVVDSECDGIETVADIFSGTGAVASAFQDKQLITNDILYSNYICNYAWFSSRKYNRKKLERVIDSYNRNLLGGLYRENPVKSRNYEAVKSSKKWENVGNSYIIPALLLYRYSYI